MSVSKFSLIMLASLSANAQAAPPPVEHFARMPMITDVDVSPSGERASALIRTASADEYSFRVFEYKEGYKQIYSVMQDEKLRINNPIWMTDDRIIFSLRMASKRYGTDTIETRLMGLTPSSGEIEWLFRRAVDDGIPQLQTNIVSLLPSDPSKVLVQYRRPGDDLRVYKVATDAAKRHRVVQTYRNQNIMDWTADSSGVIRSGRGIVGDKREKLTVLSPDDKWLDISERVAPGTPNFRFAGFPLDRTKAYVTSTHEFPTAALYEYDIANDKIGELIFNHPTSDVYGIVQKREDGTAIGVTYAEAEHQIEWLADGFAAQIFSTLKKAFPGKAITLAGLNQNDDHAVVIINEGIRPGEYYVFDINNRSLAPLGGTYPELSDVPLGRIFTTSYAARDGLEIPAFVTLPPGVKTLSDLQKIPFVVLPHGGPTARTYAGFDWETQFLASRGYGVLQMNFRGSSGYGEEFRAAGDLQWGQAMQDDITDGTQWLIDQGYADPDRIAIMGASYGGYAALMGLVKTPDMYQCAVVHGAVTDLPKLLSDAKNYVGGKYGTRHIGRLWTDRQMLRENSPANRADEIKAPVLIFHGEEDRIVDVDQAKRMVRALKRANAEHEYVQLPKGNHYLSIGNNRLTYLAKAETFLAGCLN